MQDRFIFEREVIFFNIVISFSDKIKKKKPSYRISPIQNVFNVGAEVRYNVFAFRARARVCVCFCRLGHICPQNFNPADFFVHKLAVVPKKEEESKREIKVTLKARGWCQPLWLGFGESWQASS